MNINNLFFHIHYCNSRKANDSGRHSNKIFRTLNHHEFLFFTGGRGRIAIEKKSYVIKAGMLFYIAPGVHHSIELDQAEPVSFQSVHFSFASVFFTDNKWTIKENASVLSLQHAGVIKDYYLIEDLFKKMVACWAAKQPGYEFITKTLLQQLIIAIAHDRKKQNKNDATFLKVDQIINYMHQNIAGHVRLTDLSEMVQLSSAYLSRTFKDRTGYSVIGYFNKIKMDKAKELIVEGDKKINEIAHELGFADEFYFSRLFKKMEGISPSEFYDKNVHGL